MRVLKSLYQDDLHEINKEDLLDKIKHGAHFSFSFLVLLITSSIVSTLGLLMNSPAVIIGGMIISPLMWPLMKISIGISYTREHYVKQALILLSMSIGVSLLSAIVITFLSPVKAITDEILARSSPTLLDVFVALSAGAVAALAMAQKRISESLAGVAVATSLMPPLCVSGIGLALFDLPVFAGGLLLFITNVISIIFISIFTFTFLGIKGRKKVFRTEGVIFVTVALILTAIPLFFFLSDVSMRSRIHKNVQTVLQNEFEAISEDIYIQNIRSTVLRGEEQVEVEADVIIPEELTLDYEQRQNVISNLENNIQKKIDLTLRVQKTIALESEEDRQHQQLKQTLIDTFRDAIGQVDSSFTIDSLDVVYEQEKLVWVVASVLRGDPSVQFTESQRNEIEEQLVQSINGKVDLDIEILSRVQLRSQPDLENDQIRQDVQKFFTSLSDQIDFSSVSVRTPEQDVEVGPQQQEDIVLITVDMRVPPFVTITSRDLDDLNRVLEETYGKKFSIQMNVVEKQVFVY